MEVTLPYEELATFQYYCQKNGLRILETKYETKIHCVIETTREEKEKIDKELDEKRLNLQQVKIIQEKMIKK